MSPIPTWSHSTNCHSSFNEHPDLYLGKERAGRQGERGREEMEGEGEGEGRKEREERKKGKKRKEIVYKQAFFTKPLRCV